MDITAAAIAALVDGTLTGNPDRVIRDVAEIEDAVTDTVTFLSNPNRSALIEQTGAGVILVPAGVTHSEKTIITVDHPSLAFIRVLNHFRPRRPLPSVQHPAAVIGSGCTIGEDVAVGPYCVIGEDCTIGDGVCLYPHVVVGDHVTIGNHSIIYPHVTLYAATVIGSDVIIHSGSVIGSDGFGYIPHQGRSVKVPQTGRVIIEDQVEIGANVTIDRAMISETRIGRGSKIDNLVQIAHNVTLGENVVLAGQVGIAGSATIGSQVSLGGQVAVRDHIRIGDRVQVGAKSGIVNDIPDGETYWGLPARPINTALRLQACIDDLPRMKKRLSDLESKK